MLRREVSRFLLCPMQEKSRYGKSIFPHSSPFLWKGQTSAARRGWLATFFNRRFPHFASASRLLRRYAPPITPAPLPKEEGRMVWVPLSPHLQSVPCALPYCLLTRLPIHPCPPSRWEGGFGVPPAFTHTSFIGLQGGSRASLEMTIRRKRHPPITPTPFRWKEYPNSVLHTACTLSGPSGHLPHAGKAGDTGIPVPSHQSLVTSH